MSSGDPQAPLGAYGTVTIDSGTLARTKSPAPGPKGLSTKSSAGKPTVAELRGQVVAFARDRVGQTVGAGECFDLADQALRNAGAKTAADFGPVTANGNYHWGTQINLSDLRPGDIIQFRNYSFVHKTIESDGSWSEQSGDRPHHTAIVDRVVGHGTVVVLEQNVPEHEPVQRCELYFSNSNTSSGGTTTINTVHGHFWFYRPQPH